MAPLRGPFDVPDGSFHEKVWDVVARIPRGRVASYKLVGMVAGHPRSARFVGRALTMSKASSLPWHRVVGADGRCLIGDPGLRKEQMERLRREGVDVSPEGRLDYVRYEWRVRSPPRDASEGRVTGPSPGGRTSPRRPPGRS